tara:strand:+ start:1008 stop:2090 length:1083 start_codon:yes stop_codon:yes gene_type:complete
MFRKTYIGDYYSSPFCRYGGSFKSHNAIKLSAQTTKEWADYKGVDVKKFDYVIYGNSVHQDHGFWSGPWSAALLGAEKTPGIMISQACTTGLFSLFQSATMIETDVYNNVYNLTSDRTSNGPVITWPDSMKKEVWVKDNFEWDPWGETSMIQTAERVREMFKISKEELDDCTVEKYEQYQNAPERTYIFPTAGVDKDEGIKKISIERLRKLRRNNSHSVGNCTQPADGHTGIVVTSKKTDVKIISFAMSRVEKGYMPRASIPASYTALRKANLTIDDIKVINQHNAFAVNDIAFCKEFELPTSKLNNWGSPLVYGHPQSPVLSRLAIEAIEETKTLGGGYCLVTGAAAGDLGAAMIFKVD